MKCENIQFNLPVYADDVLTEAERAAIENHLPRCPLCRQRFADLQMIRADLRGMERPELPANLLASMRTRISAEINQTKRKPKSFFSDDARRWLQMTVMPYGVATVVSLTFAFALLWSLASAEIPSRNIEIARLQTFGKSPALTLDKNTAASGFGDFEITPAAYAAERLSVSGDSPSLNPNGALIALTKSFIRGKMKDEEVVVVADVFGSGLARISEIIEPASGDRRRVRELEMALENNDSNFAPFVPAVLDNRSEMVRVVLRIQRVDIQTHTKKSERVKK